LLIHLNVHKLIIFLDILDSGIIVVLLITLLTFMEEQQTHYFCK